MNVISLVLFAVYSVQYLIVILCLCSPPVCEGRLREDESVVFDTYVHALEGFSRLLKLLKISTNNSYSSENKAKYIKTTYL